MKLLFDKEAEGSIQDTVRVFRWETPDGRVSIELPESVSDMQEEKKESNYPYKDRPEIILEDEDSDMQITIQFLEKEMKEEDTRVAAQKVCKLTRAVFPQYKSSPVYVCDEDDITIGWFLLYMEDMGREHVKAVFSVDKKMVLLTMTYPEEDNYKWRPIIKYIFASIEVKKESAGALGWNR